MVKGKDVAVAGLPYLGRSYSEMECQEFVERCLADCGIKKNLPGSNAWYREVMKNGWVGTPEECVKKFGAVPLGAFLFILEQDGKEPEKYHGDGVGNASHIGLVTGQGKGAIHSSSSKGQVCESEFHNKTIKNGGWNRVGLWNQIDYGTKADPEPEPELTPKPDPSPTPLPTTATVFAHSGSTVNIRRHANIGAALVERIPIGETVDVLQYGDEWCRVKWRWFTGWMKTNFLVFDGDVPPIYYTVTIPGCSKKKAEAILREYPNGTMAVG